MKKKLLAVLMTGIMAASFAGNSYSCLCRQEMTIHLNRMGMGSELQHQIYADGW